MQPKTTDPTAPRPSEPPDGAYHETHDTFGCAECGAEVTRTQPSYRHAA